jgi:hypothetical protein
MIDQTFKTKTIIAEVFDSMKTSTTYAESLARALPLDKLGSARVKAGFGFKF